MTPEENRDFRDELHGNFQGIGAELTLRSGAVTIVTPLKGSPAEAAGIMPEDIVIKVDNEDITGKPLNEVVKKIRGPKGSKVLITVLRKSEMDTLDITVTRDTITVPSVTSEMKDGDIAYININQFGDDTQKLFNEQFIGLMQKNPKGIILDLRSNGGGYLDGAIDIASSFLTAGKNVVQVKTRSETIEDPSVFKSVTNTETPLIVLINKGSASSSEIVSGALQDHKRALILGEQSFGKGTVQEIIPLNEGASLRVTIAEWLTPNGHTIHKTGITPNVKVEKTKQDFEDKKDPQLDKALEILKGGNWKDYLEGKLIATPIEAVKAVEEKK
jgi:carboxyl-terminal processing protease